MKRRIVLHGPSTLTVSLPSRWVKRLGLKKGDEVAVDENGTELRITSESNKSFSSKELDIGTLKRVGKSCLTASYRQGFDELKFTYADPSYNEIVQEVISRELTGFEIIHHGPNNCTIKDLTQHSPAEFDNALRRIWLLMNDLSNQVYTFIDKGDYTRKKQVQLIDGSINKFSNYCLRSLAKKANANPKSLVMYHMIKTLEKLSDRYKDMYQFMAQNHIKASKEFLVTLKNLNEHVSKVYDAFYKEGLEIIESLFESNQKIRESLSDLHLSHASYLTSISGDAKDIFSSIIELKL